MQARSVDEELDDLHAVLADLLHGRLPPTRVPLYQQLVQMGMQKVVHATALLRAKDGWTMDQIINDWQTRRRIVSGDPIVAEMKHAAADAIYVARRPAANHPATPAPHRGPAVSPGEAAARDRIAQDFARGHLQRARQAAGPVPCRTPADLRQGPGMRR